MFEPVLRFLVCSDIHYEDEVTPVRKYFEDYVTMGYELARQHPRYKSLDALYICGDFLNTGTEAQFLAFRDSLQRVVREETKVVPLLAGHEYVHAAGNGHDAVGKIADMFGPDFWDTVNAPVYAVERLRDILGCEEDTHNVINGFHFIAISNTRTATQWYDSYTKEKMDWLLEQVRIACEDSPNRPVFLFQHHHLYGTVYGKDGWSKPELCLPLVKYPQIVDFSGHSHAPCTDPRSVFQRDYTCVGTGAMYYVEYNDYNAAQGWSA